MGYAHLSPEGHQYPQGHGNTHGNSHGSASNTPSTHNPLHFKSHSQSQSQYRDSGSSKKRSHISHTSHNHHSPHVESAAVETEIDSFMDSGTSQVVGRIITAFHLLGSCESSLDIHTDSTSTMLVPPNSSTSTSTSSSDNRKGKSIAVSLIEKLPCGTATQEFLRPLVKKAKRKGGVSAGRDGIIQPARVSLEDLKRL